MLDYLEYLNVPTKVALAMVIVFFCVQLIGGFLDMKGKVVPEYLNIKAYFSRKKREREVLHQMPSALENVKQRFIVFFWWQFFRLKIRRNGRLWLHLQLL